MIFRASSDVGGTFTDLCVFDKVTGGWQIFKSPTTLEDITIGVLETLRLASEYYKLPLAEFMSRCESFVHGSTIMTNAIIEKKVAKTGLICTQGFRGLLTHGEITKSGFEWDLDFPEPYVPRYLTLPVTERINSEGGVETPLDEDEVREVIKQFKEYKVEVIAVCLLWSIVNAAHERRVAEIIKEEWPEVPVVLSSELNPIIREYRRTSSTVINASLLTIIKDYTNNLRDKLREVGYRKQVSMFSSTGGQVTAEEIIRRPILGVNSGPAMAPAAGHAVAKLELGAKNAITCDMGGTSFDVSVVTDGTIILSRECKVGGHYLGINMVDSRSIGAGGGSIAWIDPGGLLHVGPQSASSVPGPACYMRGGKEPTVTDANVVLGYIDPDYFLGGRMRIDPQLAEEAIREKVAQPLNLDTTEAAFTIWATINHNMLTALQDITVKRGIDPREYLVVAGGGAAGVHLQYIAKQLGVKSVLVPKFAAALSATGGMLCDAIGEFSTSYFTESNQFDYDAVNDVLAGLEEKARAFLQRQGISPEKGQVEFYLEARYPYQVWELDVPIRGNRITERELEQLVNSFHEVHEKVLAVKEPGQYIECVNWRVRAVGEVAKPEFEEKPYGGEDASAALRGRRRAYFKERGGFVETPIYEDSKLVPGNKIGGPAIIEAPATTIVVMPGGSASITKMGNYYIELLD